MDAKQVLSHVAIRAPVKPRLLIKVSSNLLHHIDVFEHLRSNDEYYDQSICVGGGEQINAAFEIDGHPVSFSPFGRICETPRQRILVRDVLLMNAQRLRDRLSIQRIKARVFIPFLDEAVGGALCNLDADWMPILLYDGFDEFLVFTLDKNIEKKRKFYRDIWQRCGGSGDPPKIGVLGFS